MMITSWMCSFLLLALTAFYAVKWIGLVDVIETAKVKGKSLSSPLRGGISSLTTIANFNDEKKRAVNETATSAAAALLKDDQTSPEVENVTETTGVPPAQLKDDQTSLVVDNVTETTEAAAQLKDDQTSSDLSWKEKMMAHFSKQPCRTSSADTSQPEAWLKQMFILIGVQKGGTKAIHTFLEENPQFVSRCDQKSATIELNFFNRIEDADPEIDQRELQIRYSNLIQSKCPLATDTLAKDASMMYLDDSPLYLQDSHSVPQLLNCVMPKAKIMSVLRNPTDRAFSHFNFYLDYDWCANKSFDEWVDINLQELKESGVLDAKDPYEELLAWQHYNINQNDRKCRTFVTRGIYAIQMLHYITALEAAGRPKTDIHVIHSADMQGEGRQHEYDTILNFLGLEPHTLEHEGPVHKTVYERSMLNSTRAKLDDFYRPYNRRLYELLDWKPVWE
jgi:hypothetical protein